MEEDLCLVKIDPEYCDYLRKFENKVPYNKDKKVNRPFVGVLFEIGDIKYFAPLSSPKPKHLKLKSKIDLLKIDNGKLGVVNFNNMIPVTIDNIKLIDLETKTKDLSLIKYFLLLKKQLYWLNRHKEIVIGRSEKLYQKYRNGILGYSVSLRTCDFNLLEIKCREYNKSKVNS